MILNLSQTITRFNLTSLGYPYQPRDKLEPPLRVSGTKSIQCQQAMTALQGLSKNRKLLHVLWPLSYAASQVLFFLFTTSNIFESEITKLIDTWKAKLKLAFQILAIKFDESFCVEFRLWLPKAIIWGSIENTILFLFFLMLLPHR